MLQPWRDCCKKNVADLGSELRGERREKIFFRRNGFSFQKSFFKGSLSAASEPREFRGHLVGRRWENRDEEIVIVKPDRLIDDP